VWSSTYTSAIRCAKADRKLYHYHAHYMYHPSQHYVKNVKTMTTNSDSFNLNIWMTFLFRLKGLQQLVTRTGSRAVHEQRVATFTNDKLKYNIYKDPDIIKLVAKKSVPLFPLTFLRS
jgi:hypothetical protein